MLDKKSDYEFVTVDDVDIQGKILPLVGGANAPLRREDLAYLTEMSIFFSNPTGVIPTSIPYNVDPYFVNTLISRAKNASSVDKFSSNLPIYTFPVTTTNYPAELKDYLGDEYGINYLSSDVSNLTSGSPIKSQLLLDLYEIFNQRYYKRVLNKETSSANVPETFTFLRQSQNATATHSYRGTDSQYHDIVLTTNVTFDISECAGSVYGSILYPYGRRQYYPFSFGTYPAWHDNKNEYLWYRNGLHSDASVIFDLHRSDVEDAYMFMWYCAELNNGYRYQFKQSKMTKVGNTTWSGKVFDLAMVEEYATTHAGYDSSKIGTYSSSEGTGASINVMFKGIFAKYGSKFYFTSAT